MKDLIPLLLSERRTQREFLSPRPIQQRLSPLDSKRNFIDTVMSESSNLRLKQHAKMILNQYPKNPANRNMAMSYCKVDVSDEGRTGGFKFTPKVHQSFARRNFSCLESGRTVPLSYLNSPRNVSNVKSKYFDVHDRPVKERLFRYQPPRLSKARDVYELPLVPSLASPHAAQRGTTVFT